MPPAAYGAVPPRVRRSVRGHGALLIVAGALGAIGSIGPWAWVRGGSARRFSSFDETISGLGGGGALTLALSATITIMGILLVRQTLLGLSITALCCGAFAVLVGLGNVATISAAASQVRLQYGIDAGTSWGLWLTIVASAVGAVGGLVALIRGRWIDPREQVGPAPGSSRFGGAHV